MAFFLQISSGITEVAREFSGILLDAYGVFWGGNELGLLPGSKEAMEALVTSGKIVGILSNSTQLVAKEKEKFLSKGLIEGKHFHFLITSGELARSLFLSEKLPFSTHFNRFFVFGKPHPRFSSHEAIFQGSSYTETADISEADFIHLAVPHLAGEDQTDPELFYNEVRKLGTKLPMVCLNPDRFAHEGIPPRKVVRQGSLAAIYEQLGGTVHYVGKPYTMSFESAMNQFHLHGIVRPEEVLMVGDTPETDIRGSRQYGLFSALITKTGIMADRISHEGLEKAINELTRQEYPDFFVERFVK